MNCCFYLFADVTRNEENERNTRRDRAWPPVRLRELRRNRRVYTDSSVERRQAKTVTLWERQRGTRKGHTPPLSLSLSLFLEDSRGRDTEEKKRENSCEDILYSWTRALERRIVTGVQRGRNFGGVFSLKQLSIGFPLEEGCPSPASTIPRPGLLFRLEVKWPMNGKIEERILSKRKLVATPPWKACDERCTRYTRA